MLRFVLFLALSLGLQAAAFAQSMTVTNFPSDVEFQTGDTWNYAGKSYRLYGVQSCLRNTGYKYDGVETDCGLHSLSQLASLFKKSIVTCVEIGPAKDGATFVTCNIIVRNTELDLGQAMVVSGYAFAALDIKGQPVADAYVVAEATAQAKTNGLWAGVFVHPVKYLLGNSQKMLQQQ
jgi:endonuclease YncB( thermonuclease family)